MDSESPSRDGYAVELSEEIDADLASRLADAVPPPVCEWQEGRMPAPCGVTATHICILACGHSFYYCDEHTEARREYVAAPGSNWCRGRIDGGRLHNGNALADPVRLERLDR